MDMLNQSNDTEIINVSSYLKQMARKHPFKRAVVYPADRDKSGRIAYSHLTFLQLDRESDCMAHGLEAAGIVRGTRTILMVKPSPEFFILTFALFKVGAVPVVVDPGMGINRMLRCLQESDPEAFIGIPLAHVLRKFYPKFFKTVNTWVTVGRRWFWGGRTLTGMSPLGIFALQAALLPGAVGLWAVDEFRVRGGGTPLPYDPPVRLVTTGPYAYVRNPMQLSMVLMFVGLAAALGSPWLLAGAGLMTLYSAGLAAWDERGDLEARHGDEYTEYKSSVRNWWPRYTPYVRAEATLYLGDGCEPCSGLGGFVTRISPKRLKMRPASEHPERDLERVTYRDGSFEVSGVEAVARTLERANLFHALFALPLRLPGFRTAAQMFVDAAGGGPRKISRRAGRPDP